MRIPLIVLLVLACAASAHAFSGGPPNAHTNAPGELNCTACHTTFALNSGSGGITVDGVPGGWQPLTVYDLTVTVDDPDATRWGYEFTVLDTGGNSTGTLTLLDTDSQLSTAGPRTYAKQTFAGTKAGTTGSASWTVRWTSPAAGVGDITVYVAANGANNNGLNSGDRIYATSETWLDGAVSAAGLPALAELDLKPNYPNPFNPRTTIAYELARDATVRLEIYALDGSLVRRLVNRFETAGGHEVSWNGLDRRGRAAPSGIYLYRIVADGATATRRMTLVR
jgi:hypothetical protein